MIKKGFVKKNKASISIIIFMILFFSIHEFKPPIFYNKDGSLRQFGLGTKKKTVIPIWFLTLILAIFCYLFVLYYLAIPKFRY